MSMDIRELEHKVGECQINDTDFDLVQLEALGVELREEGRLEILREIAASGEPLIVPSRVCWFCERVIVELENHQPTCLWLRAVRATQEPVK